MKHWKLILVSLLLIVGCSQQQAATPTAQPSIVLQSQNAAGQIVISVSAQHIPHMQGAQFDLRYDPAVLQFDKAQEGSLLHADGVQTMFLLDQNQQPGLVKNVGVIRISKIDVVGDGVLATVTFHRLTPGTTQVSLEKVIVVNNATQQVTVSTKGISVS